MELKYIQNCLHIDNWARYDVIHRHLALYLEERRNKRFFMLNGRASDRAKIWDSLKIEILTVRVSSLNFRRINSRKIFLYSNSY